MTEKEINDIVARQRKYFQTGATLRWICGFPVCAGFMPLL